MERNGMIRTQNLNENRKTLSAPVRGSPQKWREMLKGGQRILYGGFFVRMDFSARAGMRTQ